MGHSSTYVLELLKLGLGPLDRYGTNQLTINGRPEQKFLPSQAQDRNGLRRGHYSSLHAFVSFKLPILTDKNLNMTLLP